jgi:hypothetical protein
MKELESSRLCYLLQAAGRSMNPHLKFTNSISAGYWIRLSTSSGPTPTQNVAYSGVMQNVSENLEKISEPQALSAGFGKTVLR